ncbi:NAD-dependent epimerase/dehydratase family protein [Actinoplanes sp. NPDC051859]|uniref:NAD-dependent epimerase/dehydratase family protein n=1 Tax=Actinoplanes sp. NPDC051859 TaxID=3363909 RepID=UPI0037BCE4F6
MTAEPRPGDPLAGRRIVVTGAHGAIGSHLVRRLIASSADVLCLDTAPPTTSRLASPHLSTVRCDIRSRALPATIAAHQPDVVVHLAAQVGIPVSVTQPGYDADVNIRGTIAVAEATAAAGARLVFAATCAIYGHPDRLPVTETAPLAPISPYGLSKAAAVQYLDWFAAHHRLPVTSLILGNVYGAGTPNAVVDRLVAAAAAGTPSVLHGDGNATRDFVHIDDVTEAFAAACLAPAAGRVNIGSGTETRIRDVHRLIACRIPHMVPALRSPARPGDIPRMHLDVVRAADALGWRARTGLASAVAALAYDAARMRAGGADTAPSRRSPAA